MTPVYFAPVRNTVPAVALYVEAAFSRAEVDAIERLCGTLERESGQTLSGRDTARKCRIAWLRHNAASAWLFQRLHWLVHQLNESCAFDLWGFAEPLQYTVYGPGEHFDWHVDDGVYGNLPRKISLTLQLSEPDAYAGGELEIWGATKHVAGRARGSLIAFPSYSLHRVAPITSGERRSLVAWVTGPQFR